MPERKVSPLAVPRLSRYYRALSDSQEKEVISSWELAVLTGYSAAQIRKDLTNFGQFGTPGLGYPVQPLRQALRKILGMDRQWNVALAGVGRLGAALLGYKGFHAQGFRLVAAFDADPAKVGKTIENVMVFAAEKIEEIVRREKIQMAMVTVPVAAAPDMAARLVKAGVHSILNFAPVRLHLPSHITVHYVDMAMELEKLSFLSTRTEK